MKIVIKMPSIEQRYPLKPISRVPTVIIDWVNDEIPIKFECPICRHYGNLNQDEWATFLPRSNNIELCRHHICPSCSRKWVITRPHSDEVSYNGGNIKQKREIRGRPHFPEDDKMLLAKEIVNRASSELEEKGIIVKNGNYVDLLKEFDEHFTDLLRNKIGLFFRFNYWIVVFSCLEEATKPYDLSVEAREVLYRIIQSRVKGKLRHGSRGVSF